MIQQKLQNINKCQRFKERKEGKNELLNKATGVDKGHQDQDKTIRGRTIKKMFILF